MSAGFGLLLLGSCAKQPALPLSFDVSAYQGFLVPRPLLPFRGEGSAMFTLGGERESGEMELAGGGNSNAPSYRILLKARLTGALIVEIRFDEEALLVVDYLNERYYRGANTKGARNKLFALDLESGDFQMLVTGRIARNRFEQGGGWQKANRAGFREGAVEHAFELDAHGLPIRWVKSRKGHTVFQVEFREYLTLPTGVGHPPLRMPRKIRLRAPDGGMLVLGLRAIHPGDADIRPPSPGMLPPGAVNFASNLLETLP